MERREATRFRITIRLASDAGSETRQGAPCGAPCPSLFSRGATESKTRATRGSDCACANGCVNESGCLKFESTGASQVLTPRHSGTRPLGRGPGIHSSCRYGFRVRSQSCSRPGMTMDVMTRAARYTHNVVPAQAGTHNHRRLWWRRQELSGYRNNIDGSGSMGPGLRRDDVENFNRARCAPRAPRVCVQTNQ